MGGRRTEVSPIVGHRHDAIQGGCPIERLRLVLTALLLLLPALAAGAPPEPLEGETAPALTLSGSLFVTRCDCISCGPPTDPGIRWDEIKLGPEGISRSLKHRVGAWVRIPFTLDDPARFQRPALLITRSGDAEEVYLNGRLVGGEGKVTPPFILAPAAPRVVTLPTDLLVGGANLLEIKVLFMQRNAGAFRGPLRIGERREINQEARERGTTILLTETAFLSMFVFLVLFYGLLLSKGVRRPEYVFFSLFTALYAVTFLLGSYLFSLGGWSPPFLAHLLDILNQGLVLIMLPLVASATGSRFGVAFWSFFGVGAAFLALEGVAPALFLREEITGPRLLFLGLLGAYYLLMAVGAVAARRREAIPILLGIGAYVAGSRVEAFWGVSLKDYGVAAFALFMLYALVSRHARLKNRINEVSTRILDAHEEERRRIAREIHDGLGQGLLALRLRLQLLANRGRGGEPVPPQALEEVAEQTRSLLEEVRRTTTDLRPSFVEDSGLVEAMRWYAANYWGQPGIEVEVHQPADPLPEIPGRVKDNLFRIFQEALANAARHSGGTRVDVSIFTTGKGRLVMQVADNGEGFDLGAARGKGYGLTTLRERAELLGGDCQVRSSSGRGTTVTVEVPLP